MASPLADLLCGLACLTLNGFAISEPSVCHSQFTYGVYKVFHIDIVHIYVYNANMKKRELEKLLRQLGWRFFRHGGKHDNQWGA